MSALSPPDLELVMTLRIELGSPVELGAGPNGERRVIPITGGTVEGPSVTGTILDGGADIQLIRPDGVAEIDASYVIETSAGERVLVRNVGVRHGPPEAIAALRRGEVVDPAEIYFRTAPTFETSSSRLESLTRDLFVGVGARFPDHVAFQFFRVG